MDAGVREFAVQVHYSGYQQYHIKAARRPGLYPAAHAMPCITERSYMPLTILTGLVVLSHSVGSGKMKKWEGQVRIFG